MRKRLQSSCTKPDVHKNSGEVPADPGVCRIPVRIGKTTFLVREGEDTPEKRKQLKEKLDKSGGMCWGFE